MKTLILSAFVLISLGVFESVMSQTNRPIRIGISRQKAVVKNKLNLRFLEVVEDSRCPTDVNCIWAGNAKIKIQISKPGGTPKIFELNTNLPEKCILIEGYEITLASLSPYPKAGVELKKETYAAAFSVVKK